MKQELITRIRCILDFMEEFETLVSNAKKDGDEEWEDELHARLSFAESDLRTAPGRQAGARRRITVLTTKSGISLRNQK